MAERTEQLLSAFLVPGTNKEASAALRDELKKTETIGHFAQIISCSARPELRQLAAVFMRKRILQQWGNLTPQHKTELKQLLLKRIAEEQVHLVRVNIAHVVSAIGKIALNEWGQELLKFLEECAASPTSDHRECAMIVFHSLLANTGPALVSMFNSFVIVLKKGLEDPDSQRVRVRALKGVMELVQLVESKEHADTFRQLVPSMVALTKSALAQGDEEPAVLTMEIFQDSVEANSMVLTKEDLPDLVRFVLDIANSKDVPMQARSQAFDFVHYVTKLRPKVVVKNGLVPPILDTLFSLSAEEALDEEDRESAPLTVASQALDSLAINLASRAVFQPAMERVGQCLKSPNPRVRRAGVTLMGIISEGCEEPMRRHLSELVPELFRQFQDPDPSVREAAGTALGQFAEWLQPEILRYHQQAMENLAPHLDSPARPVREKCLYAIELFVSHLTPSQLRIYLPHLVPKLLQMACEDPASETETLSVQTAACATLAATAGQAKADITPYAPQILPVLQKLMTLTKYEHLSLRAGATDCAGAIASAIGFEAFRDSLGTFMALARSGLEELESNELREATYQFFSALAFAMKGGFAEFLESALGYMLASCMQPLVGGAGEDEDDFGDIAEEADDDGYANVHSGVLDEVLSALWALKTICEEVGGPVVNFVEKIVNVLKELSGCFSPDIRCRVCVVYCALAKLLHKAFPPPWEATGWQPGLPTQFGLHPNTVGLMEKVVWPELWERGTKDHDKAVIADALNAVADVLEALGPGAWGENPQGRLEGVCTELIAKILSKKHVCQEHDDDEEIEEEEDSREAENVLFEAVSSVVCSVGKTLGPKMFPQIFDKIHPKIMQLAKHKTSIAYRAIGAGALGDTLRALSTEAAPYIPAALQVAYEGIQTEGDWTLTQNSCFLLGVLYEVGSNHPNVIQTVGQALGLLQPIFAQAGEIDGMEEQSILDNACSCVCRMIAHLPSPADNLPLDQIMTVILKSLPVKEDFQESPAVLRAVQVLLTSPSQKVHQLLSTPGYLERLTAISVTEMTNPEKTVTGPLAEGMTTLLQSAVKEMGQQRVEALVTKCTGGVEEGEGVTAEAKELLMQIAEKALAGG
uniref:Importin N-terminal domain-containing protein n=1 Tax=Chromera velia CCMP2878 TaxID=1169474 RepID=A0A0G4IBL8_9ALVE|mmetsp:Transcript_18976/g.38352  ORF Transcript_18976/g.38352 Transcript_18976/m.38352 type:complete len:1101 (-) Transcript_18976:208-3510(-)|eukprot:Cvel_2209.t1-p1 / transcript=Cvel_2209.t1 / gene=Cvel_2209 / organism=Chromera_velia_CCMP2878 / gene_product=Probable importin subunit beta-4, putative / transcript_product=Probable importin subunit beta-4, putative / location=Cvel_scaffold85:63504-68334(+) / protein_length=1100 / sequence_SO=supercontig / SO=protein_coding / is_pseudo=false